MHYLTQWLTSYTISEIVIKQYPSKIILTNPGGSQGVTLETCSS